MPDKSAAPTRSATSLIHRALLRNLWPEISGQLRSVRVRITGNHTTALPGPEDVPGLLDRLVGHPPEPHAESIRQWHVAFERIHPFRDGNGRVGRIIMNAQRLQAGLPILIIPASERRLYYEWFRGGNDA